MKHHIFLGLSLAMYFISSACCTYTTINTRQHQVVFKYSNEHKSERDLPLCQQEEVCSVLHKRFWLAPLAERLCRCGNNDECPWKWTNHTDTHSMFLNSRSQLKFCSSIKHLEVCGTQDAALTVKSINSTKSSSRKSVSVTCLCTEENYWKYFRTSKGNNRINGTSKLKKEYKCAPLRKCDSHEFCGNVRTDQNSIFYSCSCPEEHYCIYSDQTKYKVHELLYHGSAYRARCEPVAKNVNY